MFQRKLSRRRLPITFVYFVSHASTQALRPITFTQRFRTTRHLFSIQLLWKPEIINVKDKQTKFERSKGDIGRISELCKSSLTRAHWASIWICVVYKMLVDESYDIAAGLRQSVTSLVYVHAWILRILSYKLVNFDMQIKVNETALLWSRLYEKCFTWSFHILSVN